MARYINSKFISFASISINKGALTSAFSIEKFLLLCTATVSILFAVLRFNSIPVGSFFDDAKYLVLAESLFNSTGYRLISLAGNPVEQAFPPGWPLILMPVVGLFPDNFVAPKMVSFLFWLATIPLIISLFGKRLSRPLLIGYVALVLINPLLIATSITVMSEPSYLFFSLLTLYFFQKWHEGSQRRNVWLFLAVFGCAAYALMIRTVGITLLAAILLFLLLKIDRRYLAIAGGVILLTLLPILWFSNQNDGTLIFSPTYSNHLSYVSSRAIDFVQVWNYRSIFEVDTIAAVVIPIFDLSTFKSIVTPELNYWLSISLLLGLLLGYVITLRKYQAMEIYVALFIGLFYVWTVYIHMVQQRQLIPILPFLYFYLVQVIYWLVNRIISNRKAATRLTLGLLFLIIVIFIGRNIHEMRDPVYNRTTNLAIGTTWLRENSPPDALVMAGNATPVFLYARRQTVYPFYSSDDLEEYILNTGVDYILIQPHLFDWSNPEHKLDEFTTLELLPVLNAKPEKYNIVYRNDAYNTIIFKVNKKNEQTNFVK